MHPSLNNTHNTKFKKLKPGLVASSPTTSGLETEWDYTGRMGGMEKQENRRNE